jgi:hypothetical protein
MEVLAMSMTIGAGHALIITLYQNSGIRDSTFRKDPSNDFNGNRFCPTDVSPFIVPWRTPFPCVPFITNDYTYAPRLGCVHLYPKVLRYSSMREMSCKA